MNNRKAATKTVRPDRSKPRNKSAAKPKSRGANTARVNVFGLFLAWCSNHYRSCVLTLQRLLSQFTSSILTWLVIGIAMALPVGLYLFLTNLESVAGGWDGNAKLSVYLKTGVNESQALALQRDIFKHHMVDEVNYLSSEDALAEFEQISGFGDILQSLPNNPLPALLEVSLSTGRAEIEAINVLVDNIANQTAVDGVQLDLHWVQRLQAILALAKQLVLVLAALLSLAVLLVTGNTIRLAIESRKDEIVIIKLVGGTDAFVRRPLLYTGFWYGVGGALVATLIVQLSMSLLSSPADKLFGLYDFHFQLQFLAFGQALLLCVGGGLLGLLGAWVSVAQHLHKIQPK